MLLFCVRQLGFLNGKKKGKGFSLKRVRFYKFIALFLIKSCGHSLVQTGTGTARLDKATQAVQPPPYFQVDYFCTEHMHQCTSLWVSTQNQVPRVGPNCIWDIYMLYKRNFCTYRI